MTTPIITRLFVHHLGCDAAGRFVEEDGGSTFDAAAYSRMKYGDANAALHFGKTMAEVLMTAHPDVLRDEIPADFLVAYKAVPPACYYLSQYCLDRINARRASVRREPGRLLQVYKSRVAASNYAAASQEARQQELDTISFTLEGRSLFGKHIILVDDVRITGAAERKILEAILPAAPRRLTLLYLAGFRENVAPQTEDNLNAAAVGGLAEIAAFIQTEHFDLNIRTLKRILSAPPAELADFLSGLSVRLIEQLLRGALATGTEFTTRYAAGYQRLRMAWRDKTEVADHAL
ncbi:hypothetical protein AGMMS49543_00540 [Betaproteobacteria bacterium]|nr:hypothetical protein AGMMS49543_00540 [Betaproteobacteria bacterium]GHU16093.1 hypothetical protein AGMMS50243_01390 [Betaproteobacteria bacterium]